jgi:hypothetical protein
MLKQFLKYAAMFAFGMYLIRLAVCYLSQVWWVLVILAALIVAGFIGWKLWQKYRGDY